MGRRIDTPVKNRLRALRSQRALTQADLARASGLSRQAINGIELGKFVPNALVALALARVLSCRVEDIFVQDDPGANIEVIGSPLPARFVAARVGSRSIAHPLSGPHAITSGFAPADGFFDGRAAGLAVDPAALGRSAFVAGCDPALPILQAFVNRADPSVRLTPVPASSSHALSLLSRGVVNIAGCHLPDGRAAGNVTAAGDALGGAEGSVLTFARWEQGLAVAPNNPKRILSVTDLARPGVRLINRDAGSGSRSALDDWLSEAGVAAADVPGYDTIAESHTAVALAVRSGAADAGVTLRAIAEAFGLAFIPVGEVRFDLVIPASETTHPAVAVLLDVLQSRSLREELARLPGYGVTETGALRASLAAA